MATTLVERLLQLAEDLIGAHPRSSAVKRRAVSTAYYAAFHALARVCADSLLKDADRGSDIYGRVYRALDHGPLRNAFQAKGSPLITRPALRRIGDLIVPLQGARMLADYAPPRIDFYEESEASDRVAEARDLIESLPDLSDDDRLTLAVHLIFKDRPR